MSPSKQSRTLHEHLHYQLRQLIAVDSPDSNGKAAARKNTSNSTNPRTLLKLSQNESRRQKKVETVSRLLEALREDQSAFSKNPNNSSSDGETQSNYDGIGRIHGCIASHWELLPPIYPDTNEMDIEEVDSGTLPDDVDDHSRRKRSESTSSWQLPSKTDEYNMPSSTHEKEERVYPQIRGGGLRLPGLDWNKTFRKGYTILVWVRPTLNCSSSPIPKKAAVRKQVLYRLASSLHDNVIGAVGVCAILGQWEAVSCKVNGGERRRTMLTSTMTAYTLPNSDPMSHLYPMNPTTKKDTTEATLEESADGKSAHERNMEHFRQHKHDPAISSSNKGRLLKGKKASKPAFGNDKSSNKDSIQPSSTGGYVTAQLTLPADEWSLIGIQHTHPYLRRPELIISVNGEEVVKGELAYPILDAVSGGAEEDVAQGISAMTLSSSSPKKAQNGDGALGATASFLNDSERKTLKRRGILAECTLLDGAFENGVLVDETNGKNKPDHNDQRKKSNCVLSVHSLALLSSMVPNVVLGMIAERGPLGDSASGSGLSFLLGPVPTNPQNRDAIVALLAGYGYYGNGGSSSTIGASGHVQDKFVLPPRSIGIPVSIGVTPGVTLRKTGRSSRDGSFNPSDAESQSWIGDEKEFDAHIMLQGLVGRAILTFHAGDTRSLGHFNARDEITTRQGRIICQPSAASSYIGGADDVPKVGIVRPSSPAPHSTSARLEVTGNARYYNATLTYIRKESLRESCEIVAFANNNCKDDNTAPVSLTRAIHASNAANHALLPFRLALPKAGNEEVNSAQHILYSESFIHLYDLLSNQAQLAGLLIEFLNECILSCGSAMRDESLQNGTLHALTNLLRKVLIRGLRLGLLSKVGQMNRLADMGDCGENMDYDFCHDSCSPHVIPSPIRMALMQLVDVCCGPVGGINLDSHEHAMFDTFRGVLRIRRSSDLALTAIFAVSLDFDLLARDLTASASIIQAVAQRYGQVSHGMLNKSKLAPQEEPVYGSLLRSQMNIQYFLDSIRVRFDYSVSMSPKHADKYSDEERVALILIAHSLSDVLYSMLLSSLTSASGSAVTRGERDIGALVATLTECPFGTVCSSVVTNTIAKLLIKCGVLSPRCLERCSYKLEVTHQRRETTDLALENRLARNMLLSHYHDIVGPLILSKCAPNYSINFVQSKEENEENDNSQTVLSCSVGAISNKSFPLDWAYDWRLSLMTFTWLSSLAGSEERRLTSRAAGGLILQAAQIKSLDGALTVQDSPLSGEEKSVVIDVLSNFLVLKPSAEKDINAATNKAETISRRLSVFMQLTPGIARSILSSSMKQSAVETFTISPRAIVASELLKEILSMISLSIQSLYGSKKGGLLIAKPGSNESTQRGRAKTLFVEAAREYSPIMLQVASMLEKPIATVRQEIAKANSNSSHQMTIVKVKDSLTDDGASVNGHQPRTVERKRTDSTDRDWVDVHSPEPVDCSHDTAPPPPIIPKNESISELQVSGHKCLNNLISCQDVMFYAVSRLVAQAMKYGGGEASTNVWRNIISSLVFEGDEETEATQPHAEVNGQHRSMSTNKPDEMWSKETLCHVVALVLSKFARYHDKQPTRSHWNTETCSAVARLMDLVEEKKLLADDPNNAIPKFSIDQVRLIKSVLEIMKSGRESSGWLQLQDNNIQQNHDVGATGHIDKTIDEASVHSNYQLYNQKIPAQRDSNNPNSKLLLPILQSCLRLMLPSMGVIRSEAVVISATSAGKAPSTAVLLQLVYAELNESITSAISGLTFSVSRDIFMNGIASIRHSLQYHRSTNDSKAVTLCSELALQIIEAMRRRYVNERNKKDKASSSYDDEEDSTSHHGDIVEQIILGQDQVPTNDSSDVDFLAFSGDSDAKNPNMGFMQYKGLGASLNRCYRELNDKPALGTRCLGISGFKTSENKADIALSILDPFIENWNKAMAYDDEEQELVDLFDKSQDNNTLSLQVNQFPSSDAITRFAEAQSMLKQQHKHLAFEYLKIFRYGKTAFAERLCWKTWMEIVDPKSCNSLWERGVYDGGRDYCSKMTTMPMFPQFPRFIPSYLDHSPSSLSASAVTQEIDLKGKGITIVDITKKEIDEEVIGQMFENDEDGVEDGPKDFQDEELDVLFPNHRGSQSSAKHGSLGDESDHLEHEKGDDKLENESATYNGVNSNIENIESMYQLEHENFHFALSSFSFPPDSSSLLSMGQGVRLAGGMMEEYYSSCLLVKPDCSRKCIIMLTENHLILEFEDGEGLVEGESESHQKKLRDSLDVDEVQDHDHKVLADKALRPKAMRWNISEASHIYLRRYRLRDSALEIFFIPSAGASTGGTAFFAGSRSLFIDFGAGVWGNTRRDDAANALMKRAPMQTVKQWPDKNELKKLTQAWSQGAITNFDYLSSLNCLSGRSYNDICQYPVFPWTLCNFTSETLPDLSDPTNYRDLSKPIGALNELRLSELIERFETFADPSIPPFMYGSHYSTSAGVVLHFLLRLHPFSALHRHLQSGHFDVADRLFSSVQRTWEMCTGRSAAEVKELTPEFYCNPTFLRNVNELKLGTMQEGEIVDDVALPPWANNSPEKFVEVMRMALESDVVSAQLGSWIDLIFGYKQQGKHAIEAHNVFFYLTYYGSVDVASIEDEGLRLATECQIAHFGQCPMQLFYRPHPLKREKNNRHSRQTLCDTLGLYDQAQTSTSLPFMGSPLSYWVHLAAPPPGPHAPLLSIRLTLCDRCLAVDSKGIYHFFRWAWKPEVVEDEESERNNEEPNENSPYDAYKDKGCFVAQRELMSFRNIPCLPYTPVLSQDARCVTVCMSKTLFSNRTLLLVLSDGDGKGGLAMQLVDPVKGAIKGEVIVPSAHSDFITAIDMDPIGTAAGQGGVGGELAVVGSADGSMTMWRFISSHYWPLRPRLRMAGHSGSKVHGVTVSSALGVCASISSQKCCLFDVGNGAMIRAFSPPFTACRDHLGSNLLDETATRVITFADTSAICLSTMGYVAVVCSTKLIRDSDTLDEVFSVELMTLEGVHVGSKILEPDRGIPTKLVSSVDGRALFVCMGGGVLVCLISSVQPLSFVDEWRIIEEDADDCNIFSHQAIHDIDFGPTISRPVVVAAGCSDGSLRLHALQGISKWSHENQRNIVTSAVGSVLALPAQTVKNAIGGVAGFGSRFVGLGKEIGKEAFTAVKDREGMFFRKK